MHYNLNDTIVALATPQGVGAIGVIRLSGPLAISICNSVFKGKDLNKEASHTLHFGKIVDILRKVGNDQIGAKSLSRAAGIAL